MTNLIKTTIPHNAQYGRVFRCRNHWNGERDLSIRAVGDQLWLTYRHPDGQWVTLRPATPEDLAVVDDATEADDER